MKTVNFLLCFVLLVFTGFLPLRSETADANKKTLTLKFLGPNDEPIPEATAKVWMNPKPKDWENRNFNAQADQQGIAKITFEPDEKWQSASVNVKTPGFTPFYAEWNDVKNDPLPDAYTLKLDKAKTVGGIVLDDADKPLSGAKVSFSFPWSDRQRIKVDNFHCSADATTDENGLWKVQIVPEEALPRRVLMSFEHPEFQKMSMETILSPLLPNDAGEFARTVSMKKGITVSGTVVDQQDKPITEAVVNGSAGSRGYGYSEAKTEENGHFEFKNWAPSQNEHFIVRAEGFAPELLERVVVEADMKPIKITLKPGKTFRAKVVDENGNPVPKVWFAVERWKTRRLIGTPMFGGRKETDENGEIVIPNAPEDEITFDLLPTGDAGSKYHTLRKQTLQAREEPYTLTLRPALKVAGKVTDAKTKELIPEFKVFNGFRFPGQKRIHWNTHETRIGHAGAFERNFTDVQGDHVLIKIEAEGYAPNISDEISLSKSSAELEFALEEATEETGQGIFGQVQNEQGQPVHGATVALALKNQSPYIQNGSLSSGSNCVSATTNEQGRFILPPITEEMLEDSWGGNPESDKENPDFKLFVLHPSGFAQIDKEEFAKSENTVSLQKWARVEGTVYEGTKPGKNLYLNLNIRETDWSKPRAWFDYRSTSDGEGKFVFEQVPPEKASIALAVKFAIRDGGYMSTSSHGENVELISGETTTVKVGGVGRPVIGKLALPEDFETETDWNFCHVRLTPAMQEFEKFPKMEEFNAMLKAVPENIQKESDLEVRKQLYDEWLKTEDGKRRQEILDEYNEWAKKADKKRQESYAKQRACPVDRDGSFRVVDIPPGDWSIDIQLDAPPPDGQCGSGEQLAHLKKDVSVTEIDGAVSDDAFDLGTLTLEKSEQRPRLIAVGADAPDFELKRLVAKKSGENQEETQEEIIKLSDYRGKIVVLEFWATWCGPCIEKLPEIVKLYQEQIKDNEKAELLGISIDNEDEIVLDFLSKREMPWIQLRADPQGPLCNDYGIFAVPTMIVVGPDGKVLATNPNIPQIKELIEKAN